MLSVKDVTLVYETLLSSPGMNDPVKIVMQIPRKQVLVLSKLIELGMSAKQENGQGGILEIVDRNTLDELQGISDEILKKAGLTEMKEKLDGLQTK